MHRGRTEFKDNGPRTMFAARHAPLSMEVFAPLFPAFPLRTSWLLGRSWALGPWSTSRLGATASCHGRGCCCFRRTTAASSASAATTEQMATNHTPVPDGPRGLSHDYEASGGPVDDGDFETDLPASSILVSLKPHPTADSSGPSDRNPLPSLTWWCAPV